MVQDMRVNGVEIIAVCGEPQEHVDEMMKKHNLTFTCFSDPQHTLRNYLLEKKYIDIKISGGEKSTEEFYTTHAYMGRFKYGVAQPGVLCIRKDNKVLFSWAIEPLTSNYNGAKDRPVPTTIWEVVVKGKLANPETADEPVDYCVLPLHTTLD